MWRASNVATFYWVFLFEHLSLSSWQKKGWSWKVWKCSWKCFDRHRRRCWGIWRWSGWWWRRPPGAAAASPSPAHRQHLCCHCAHEDEDDKNGDFLALLGFTCPHIWVSSNIQIFTWRRRRRVRISETAIKAAVPPVLFVFVFVFFHLFCLFFVFVFFHLFCLFVYDSFACG